MTERQTPIDLNEEAREKLQKITNALMEFCSIYRLPMFVSIVVKNDTQNTEYNNTVYSPQAHNIILKNDRIRKHMLIANDFEAVPGREYMSLDMDEMFSDKE